MDAGLRTTYTPPRNQIRRVGEIEPIPETARSSAHVMRHAPGRPSRVNVSASRQKSLVLMLRAEAKATAPRGGSQAPTLYLGSRFSRSSPKLPAKSKKSVIAG